MRPTNQLIVAESAAQANLDVTGATDGKRKPRMIKNPQPKLNPERLMGPRGIQTIEDYFQGWESKGKGREFDDLDVIMKNLEHWAHRLYPKLPFDNVIDVIANRLGKKKTVQTHMKKIRLGMVEAPVRIGGGDGEEGSDEEREVARYGGDAEDDQPDVFQQLLQRAGGGDTEDTAPPPATQTKPGSGGLTTEQRERMQRSRELAARRKQEKLEREQREAEEAARRQQLETQLDEDEEAEREMMASSPAPAPAAGGGQGEDKLDLDEMMLQMDED